MITETQKTWFAYEKGITEDTLEAFNVRSDEDFEWVVFPYPRGEKHRYIGPGKRQFKAVKFEENKGLGLYCGPLKDDDWCFLVEGETDTMRLWQEGINNVYGISGINGMTETDAATLSGYATIYVVLDNDADYNTSAKVDGSWRKIRTMLGSRARRILLPDDVKDIVEFFQSYSLDTLRTVVAEAATGTYHYQPLDLTAPPPKYEWLVDGLIAKGDTTLLIGEPNVGKSWVSLSLACAIANGDSTWINWDLGAHGKVLYVDEENPYDVVYHRLNQLGLHNHDNIRYLHKQGIRLDKGFDKFLDEAITYQPTLIVLDSLTRLHTQDENNAGAMAGLFNDSINTLTKETGAAVVILHHTNKVESNSSYARTRGSSDIGAAVDAAFEARKVEHGQFSLIHFKSRRKQAGDTTRLEIRDNPDGTVSLVPATAPF